MSAVGVPLRRPGIRLVSVDDGGELRRGDEVLCRLNVSAVALWVLCDGATRIDEIIDAVCEISGRPVEVVSVEVEATLADLRRNGVLDLLDDVGEHDPA
jgi:hypothetical protein